MQIIYKVTNKKLCIQKGSATKIYIIIRIIIHFTAAATTKKYKEEYLLHKLIILSDLYHFPPVLIHPLLLALLHLFEL